MEDMEKIRVCIGNYGYYAEGELRDRWLELPLEDDAAIGRWLADNGLADAAHEGIYISDWDGDPFGLAGALGEHASLADLNLLAKQMEAFPEDASRVAAALETGGADEPDGILGLMNWIAQADEVPYYGYDYAHMGALDEWGHPWDEHISNEEKMGWTALEGSPLKDALEGEGALGCFDVARFGRDAAWDYSLGEDGYLDNTQDMPDQDRYTREEIAEEVERELSRSAAAAGFTAVQDRAPDLAADLEAAASRAGCENRRESKQVTR